MESNKIELYAELGMRMKQYAISQFIVMIIGFIFGVSIYAFVFMSMDFIDMDNIYGFINGIIFILITGVILVVVGIIYVIIRFFQYLSALKLVGEFDENLNKSYKFKLYYIISSIIFPIVVIALAFWIIFNSVFESISSMDMLTFMGPYIFLIIFSIVIGLIITGLDIVSYVAFDRWAQNLPFSNPNARLIKDGANLMKICSILQIFVSVVSIGILFGMYKVGKAMENDFLGINGGGSFNNSSGGSSTHLSFNNYYSGQNSSFNEKDNEFTQDNKITQNNNTYIQKNSRICPNCKTKVKVSIAKFCPYCGCNLD